MIRKLCRWFECTVMGLHVWTSEFEERGNQVDMKRVAEYGVFKSYVMDSKMYCKHCGKESVLNKRLEKTIS